MNKMKRLVVYKITANEIVNLSIFSFFLGLSLGIGMLSNNIYSIGILVITMIISLICNICIQAKIIHEKRWKIIEYENLNIKNILL